MLVLSKFNNISFINKIYTFNKLAFLDYSFVWLEKRIVQGFCQET